MEWVICRRFQGGSGGKESACSEGDLDLIPGLGRSPGEREWQPTPVFLPEEFYGQRSLAGNRQSMGSQRLRHNRVTNAFTFTKILEEMDFSI